MIKNIIFDIGGVIAIEAGAKALTHLSEEGQKELGDILFFESEGFSKLLLGEITVEEYKKQQISRHPQYEKEIEMLFEKDEQALSYPLDQEVVDYIYSLKNRYKIYFLSNMISTSYDYLKDILNDFDGGAYSFEEHLKKPDLRFYQLLIDRYNLDVSETIFFDDKLRNVEAARKLGMRAEVFKDKNSVIEAIG